MRKSQHPAPTAESAVADFGERAKSKLTNPAVTGQPEDQLRAPFEALLQDMAAAVGLAGKVAAIGELNVAHLATRPDYAITVGGALAGFVELKAPGKGADPRRFRDAHDKHQWERLRSLPNLLYCDGNAFSLWQNGEIVDTVLNLTGEIQDAGRRLAPPPGFAMLFEGFLRWQPIAPRSAKELAHTTARLCRLLRDEVTEQLELGSPALTSLAEDWRKLLFPEANNETFADGYAQAVTFGLLMARASDIPLATGLDQVATRLAHTSSLIGTALRLLTDNVANQQTLRTALGTLVRVLDAVNWSRISKGDANAWLYFYEDFLAVYDNDLRKLTGSYYTPPEVVNAMVGLVDECLRSERFGLSAGLASRAVTLADPAMGTGTFFLGVLRRIADAIGKDQGEGAIPGAVGEALERLVAFEMQLGPFAVAQLRILAEIVALTGMPPRTQPRIFVTNTLGDPEEDAGWIPTMLAPLANQRRDANRIMREEPITIVIGNPPYKEKARGKGSWIESGSTNSKNPPPLTAWMPPRAWGLGVHAKNLRNLYVYFWRWATWKVFDHGTGAPGPHDGIVCFISVTGFLSGSGFERMRAYLRETCDDIWVIDCSPEGHQPPVNSRIFQGVQQPICIVMASRSGGKKSGAAANVRFHGLPAGTRDEKFAALAGLRLGSRAWVACPDEGRAPFLPQAIGAWASYPRLEDFFIYNGSGVMPGRTWVIAPDAASLQERWNRLKAAANPQEMEDLFHPHLVNGKPGDRSSTRVLDGPLPGLSPRAASVAADRAPMDKPVRYGFRTFDRQYIIPDKRLINRPNPELWKSRSEAQIYLTAPSDRAPTAGPALSFSALVPDLHHYNGRGGRVFPLWGDRVATESNVKPTLRRALEQHYRRTVSPPDVMAYIAATAAHPAYTTRFRQDLTSPGLRIPTTASGQLFAKAVALGCRVVWLHTFGERLIDSSDGRPAQSPRLSAARRPTIPRQGGIFDEPRQMPDTLAYEPGAQRLRVGNGFIEYVTSAMWAYEISGRHVLTQWFSYRKRNRQRPIIGDRRKPSALSDIQPDHWLPEYTTELLNLLNVLGLLIDIEPAQAALLEEICAAPLLSEAELTRLGALGTPAKPKPRARAALADEPSLF